MTAALITEPTTKNEYYSLLSEKEAEISKDCGKKFFLGARKTSEGILEAGEALIKAKKELGHGKFMWFCEYELPMKCSHDTINNFINAAKLIKKNPSLAKFNPSIIFTLAKTSTPAEVIEEVKQVAQTGGNLTVPQVKEIRQKALQKAPKPKFTKGQFVEIESEGLVGVIESVSKDFCYGIKHLHGASIKGKYAEARLKLCPVQIRQNYYDDCIKKPKKGEKVVMRPIASWRQCLEGEIATVIASVANCVFIKVEVFADPISVEWAELMPYVEPEQKIVKEMANEVLADTQVVDVKTETVVEPENELEKFTNSQLQQMMQQISQELIRRLPKNLDEQLNELVDSVLDELESEEKQLMFISLFAEQILK